jgi:F-type H+-transporting ATPase subunit delta
MDSIASRYGQALFKIAEEEKSFPLYIERFDALLSLLVLQPDFISILKNSFYTTKQKHTLIEKALPVESFGYLGSFIKLLMKNHRLVYLENILQEALLMCRQASHVQIGTVYSTFALNAHQMKAITEALMTQSKDQLTLTNVIDPSLIGGIRVDIEGKVYDASLLAQVTEMKQRLLKRGS